MARLTTRPKKGTTKATVKKATLELEDLRPTTFQPVAVPPARVHSRGYHWPLLLNDGDGGGEALLKWFESVERKRDMPWRKDWIDGGNGEEGVTERLQRRAYEVWVSEIMLQQTRVSTVIPYFKTWISKWPTVQDLAKANSDDVLSAWKGLGYYSRATRLHQGAQEMIDRNAKAPIPNTAEALQQFPGIGRYTAGAISSIAFGEAEPVLDGNVARVLSRQLGLYVDVKDKKSTDLLWMVADGLVKHVAGFPEKGKSKTPGDWNQALMELGSTVCTPRPKCEECPIHKTCTAYFEGDVLFNKERQDYEIPDIEDACGLCEQLDTEDLMVAPEEDDDVSEGAAKKNKKELKATSKISDYFTTRTKGATPTADTVDTNKDSSVFGSKKRKTPSSDTRMKYITTYCSLFPKKMPKKKVAEEECVVCLIKASCSSGNDQWLIEQRPAKGLLASLWQFPQSTVPASDESSTSARKAAAKKYVSSLDGGNVDVSNVQHIGELDSLIHVFTHLKLTMHVHLFSVAPDSDTALTPASLPSTSTPLRKWVATEAMENETLSTGMTRCWALAKHH